MKMIDSFTSTSSNFNVKIYLFFLSFLISLNYSCSNEQKNTSGRITVEKPDLLPIDSVKVERVEENGSSGQFQSDTQMVELFVAELWPTLRENCVKCHSVNFKGSVNNGSSFAFGTDSGFDIQQKNMQNFLAFATQFYEEDLPLPVIKAMGKRAHGGGLVLQKNSEKWNKFLKSTNDLLSLLEEKAENSAPSENINKNTVALTLSNQSDPTFDKRVLPFLERHCASCHRVEPASQSRFSMSGTLSEMEQSFLKVVSVTLSSGLSLPLAKSSANVIHGGGMVFAEDSHEYQEFSSLIRDYQSYLNQKNIKIESDSYVKQTQSDDTPALPDNGNREVAIKYYQENISPVLADSGCFGCHHPSVTPSRFRISSEEALTGSSMDSFVRLSLETYRGYPMPVAKAANLKNHGGGILFKEKTPTFEQFLKNTLTLLDILKDADSEKNPFEGIKQLSAYKVARKALIEIEGRLPTEAEEAELDANGFNALDKILDHSMATEEFYSWMDMIWEDIFFTDYHDSVNFFDRGRNPNFTIHYNPNLSSAGSGYAQGVAPAFTRKTPLRLIRFILEDGYDPDVPNKKIRPFTEVVNGRYMVANAYTAWIIGDVEKDTGLQDDAVLKYAVRSDFYTPDAYQTNVFPDPVLYPGSERYTDPYKMFRVERVVNTSVYVSGKYKYGSARLPVSGILTDPSFMSVYDSSADNKNRSRAATILKYFLDTDVMKLGIRSESVKEYEYPTVQNPGCISCHRVMDPIAGLYKNWTGTYGRYDERDKRRQWDPNMWPIGLSLDKLYDPDNTEGPGGRRLEPLEWLGEQIAADPGFPMAMSKLMFRALTGRDFEEEVISDDERLIYHQFISDLAKEFSENNFNLRYVIKKIIRSPYYAAAESGPYETIGLGTILPPEILQKKFRAVLNVSANELLAEYKLIYGGIDSYGTRVRRSTLTPAMINIQHKIAMNWAGDSGKEFAKNPEDRRLYPNGNQMVEISGQGRIPDPDLPIDDGSAAAKERITRIKANIINLVKIIDGTKLSQDDPKITELYSVFESFYQTLKTEGSGKTNWDGRFTSPRTIYDDNYVMRTWTNFLAYMMINFDFFYR